MSSSQQAMGGDRLDRAIEGLVRDCREPDKVLCHAQTIRREVFDLRLRALVRDDGCTCVATCGDTPEETGGVCKGLPR